MTRLTLRLDFSTGAQLGPGKAKLLELIGTHGSIRSAGAAMGMSYRRAWLLVDGLNRSFRLPLVETRHGGARGGGATLTALGSDVVERYRRMEAQATAAIADELQPVRDALAPDYAPSEPPRETFATASLSTLKPAKSLLRNIFPGV